MLFLFKIGFFEIDFSSVISFLIGIVLGCLIMGLLYAILLAMSLGNKKFLVKTEDDSLTAAEVKNMVIEAQNQFKDKGLRGDKSKIAHCTEICKSLVMAIAARFYPNSKKPYLELSIEETVMLAGYIQKRIDELLDRKIINKAKKIKVSQIASITEKAIQVNDSKFLEIGKKSMGAIGVVKKALNVANPAYWFRKVVMDNVINMMLGKICLILIAVVGEESYKIYSKSLFNKEVSIETNVEELLTTMDRDMSRINDEAKNNPDGLERLEDFDDEPLHSEDLEFFKRRVLKSHEVEKSYEALFDDDMEYKSREEAPTLDLEEVNDEEI